MAHPSTASYATSINIYTGDFNSHYTNWGYEINDTNGEIIYNRKDSKNMKLLFNAKDRKTFHSGRWNRFYNPGLCIVSKNKNQISTSQQNGFK